MIRQSNLMLRLLQGAPIILFIVVFAVFGALAPRFFELQSVENIIKQASYIGIVAVGMTFVLLTAGIDLSVGSNMYLSAVVAGKLMLDYNAPLWLGLLVAVGVGLLFGLVNAIAITRLQIIPFIVTLGTLAIGRGLGLTISQSEGINYPSAITAMGSTRLFGFVPVLIVIFAVVVFVAHLTLTQTTFGRQVYAVGNDLEAAKKAGINTNRVLALVYLISGMCAAIGGVVLVAQFGIVTAGFGDKDEFDAIAAVVLGGASLFGGRGSVFPGTVLGAVLVQMVLAGLIFTKVDIYLQPLVFSAIIFVAVLIDSLRNTHITKLERRNIRVEKAT
jgi:ribose/xylose/arabinose/galactoside ABC-type transport system permease subunit